MSIRQFKEQRIPYTALRLKIILSGPEVFIYVALRI